MIFIKGLMRLVEASKDAHGEYTINGHSYMNKYEADVLEVISQLESAMYDVTRKLQNGNKIVGDTNVTHKEEEHGEESVQQETDA